MRRLDAVKAFLESQTCKNDLWHPELETQVNVVPSGNRKSYKTSTNKKSTRFYDPDTGDSWFNFRVPIKAKSDDHYFKPMDMTFDLSRYALGIGVTGWNHIKNRSEFFGYDIDSIIGHSQGLSAPEIQTVVDNLKAIPWVSLYKSKSGNGYHAFVHLKDPVETTNHALHTALAKSILHMMSGMAGYQFEDKVDCVGGNMWIWHREAKPDNGAFECIKQGSLLERVPPNWKDHYGRVRVPGAQKGLVKTFSDVFGMEIGYKFANLVAKTRYCTLSERHRALLQWLDKNGKLNWWDKENNCLVTHTSYLMEAYNDTALEVRGLFYTNATGREGSEDYNCFLFPNNRGWTVRRYTKGVEEHPYWFQDTSGWTTCDFDRRPSMQGVLRAFGAVKGEKLDYRFKTTKDMTQAVEAMGYRLQVPGPLMGRPGFLYEKKNNLILKVPFEAHDASSLDMAGWRPQPDNRPKFWTCVLKVKSQITTEPENNDEVLRALVHKGNFEAFFVRTVTGHWIMQPASNLSDAIQAFGFSAAEARVMKGAATINPWTLVSKPFEMEYPGDREWNLKAAKLAYLPEEGDHPHWDLIFQHMGQGLNDAVMVDPWCQRHAINTGADYLVLWVAHMFQNPEKSLPFLFFYSTEQNTGKSTLHESLSLLFKDQQGYVRAENALKNQQNFNGELHGAVLCVVEEMNLNHRNVYDRIKDWVTARHLSVHPKGGTPYTAPNTCHWIHLANDPTYCPVFEGDTRIVMTNVPPLENEIDTHTLAERLREEAPAFTYAILNRHIPPPIGRLHIPVLETSVKEQTLEAKKNPFETFCAECVFEVKGSLLNATELYVAAGEWIRNHFGAADADHWTERRMQKSVPRHWVKGLHGSERKTYYANLSLDEDRIPSGQWIKVRNSRELTKLPS